MDSELHDNLGAKREQGQTARQGLIENTYGGPTYRGLCRCGSHVSRVGFARCALVGSQRAQATL